MALFQRQQPTGRWQPFGLLLTAVALGMMLAWLPLPLAAAVIGGTAVLLLIFIQPLVGLGLALLLGPWGALENIVWGNALLDSGQLLLLITLGAWLARGLKRGRVIVPQLFLNGPLALFIGLAAVSLLGAPSLPFGIRELLKWVEMALIMWLVVDLAGKEALGSAGPRIILALLLLAGLSQALVGIWQFGLRGDGPEHFIILGRFYRAYGTFEQPNPFGGYMSLNASLALGTLAGLIAARLSRPGRGPSTSIANRLWFFFVAGCAGLTTLALLFSWSRGAWLGFAAALAAGAFFFTRRRRLGLVVLGMALGLFLLTWQFALIPPSIAGRLGSFTADFRLGDVRGVDINDANYAVLERLAHWQAALDMARDNLWLGVGFGNYEPAYATYALINWPYPLGHAHNYYLNILAETGLLGALAYGLFWTAVFWQTIACLRRLDWPRRGIALGLVAAWTTLAAHHLVDNLYVNNVYIHLGAMLGLLQLLVDRPAEVAEVGGFIKE